MLHDNSLPLGPGTSRAKKLDSQRWRTIFQILTVIGMIMVLISLLLLLQSLGAGDAPRASLRM